MRSSVRVLLCVSAFVAAFLTARVDLGGATVTDMALFGGAVLVGDGEVFAGESANQFRPGIVYVYRKTGGSWVEAMQLTAPKAAVSDGFGSSLALDGSTLFVGAGPTSVHVFTKQGAVWTFASTIDAASVPMPPAAAPAPAPATPPPAGTPQTPAAAPATNVARFGTAIAAAGDWLLVGKEVVGGRGRGIPQAAPGGGRAGGPAPAAPSGAVFAFKRSGSGQYAYHATIASAAADAAGDRFGTSVALAGTMAIIGAPGQASGSGVVHEFGLDAADGQWKSQRTFAAVGLPPNGAFGTLVSLQGDQAAVAAPGEAGGYGAVYVFRRVTQQTGRGGGAAAPGTGNIVWGELARLAAPAGSRADRIGSALATGERDVWVGAPGAGGAGRVFVFAGSPTGFQMDGLKLVGPAWTDPINAGASVSVRGNVAAVGATSANRGGGGLFIYERDAFGAWRDQPMMTTPLDELPAIHRQRAPLRQLRQDRSVRVRRRGSPVVPAAIPPYARRALHPGQQSVGLDRQPDETGVGHPGPPRRHDFRRHHRPDAAACRRRPPAD